MLYVKFLMRNWQFYFIQQKTDFCVTLLNMLTGLSGVDLFMADLKALEAYASYFYYLSKIWSKPLPEVYNPQDVVDYFLCRPHIVALRLLEVF